ncbi:MAG: MATE family efflux transporter [Acidimicrobiales bacterium]|nr:MATE family efflux transporter [Acidimicrobiales bacterium]
MSRPFDREIARLAFPALVTLLSEPLYLLVDTGVVGHLGAEALGAVALASALLLTVVTLCIFLVYGTTASVARLIGAGDRRGAADDGVQGLWLAAWVGILLAVVLAAGSHPLVEILGGSGRTGAMAVSYLRISTPGVPFLLVGFGGSGYLRGIQRTTPPMLVAVAGAIVNILADLILIPGLGYGVGASAFGTVVAQVITGIALAVLVVRAAQSEGAPLRPRWLAQRRMIRVGADLAVRTAALRLSLLLLTAVAARIGTDELAAHQIAFEIWNFLALALDSLAIAGQAMVGLRLGRGDGEEARAVANRLLRLGLIAGGAVAVVVLAASPVLPRVFTPDAEVVGLVRFLLLWVALLQPLASLAWVLDGVLIGAGDQRFLAVAMVFAAVVFAVSAAPIVPLGLGIGWLWAAYATLLLARVVVLGIRYRGDRWMRLGSVV